MWHNPLGGKVARPALARHTSHVHDSCVWHDSLIYTTWLILICDMTHSYLWYDSLGDRVTHSARAPYQLPPWLHDPFACVPCLICVRVMPHAYMWYKSLGGRVAEPALARHVSHVHDSSVCGTWLIHICVITYLAAECSSQHSRAISLLSTTVNILGTSWLFKTFIGLFRLNTRLFWATHEWVVIWRQRRAEPALARHVIHVHDSLVCVTWLIHICDIPNVEADWQSQRSRAVSVLSMKFKKLGNSMTFQDFHRALSIEYRPFSRNT